MLQTAELGVLEVNLVHLFNCNVGHKINNKTAEQKLLLQAGATQLQNKYFWLCALITHQLILNFSS